MTKVALYVAIILLILLLMYLLIKEPSHQENNKETPEAHQKEEESKEEIRVSKGKDTFEIVRSLPRDLALIHLENKYKIVRKVIPEFPALPSCLPHPPTNKGSFSSYGERYCVEFLEVLFPEHKFKKVRPEWLVNPVTGRRLELDGYNEELKLAVEYNGIQHYVYPNFTGCTEEEFKNQLYRDKLKETLCDKHGVCLIRIPYSVPLADIPIAIYSILLDSVPEITWD